MRLVLLGDPVDHSRSPAIHAAAIEASGLEGTYEALAVDHEGLLEAITEIAAGRIHGANITMPHKAAAAAAADAIDHLVEATGVANTLRGSPGRPGVVEATNTDVGGLLAAAKVAGIPSDAPVLILGAGGAAAAAAHAFGDRDAMVSSRSGATVGGVPRLPWGEPRPGAVVVNATPLGMAGQPLPDGLVEGAVGLLDMAYGVDPTPAITTATRMEIPVVDGIELLVAQAAISFMWWTGLPAPFGAMQAAARA